MTAADRKLLESFERALARQKLRLVYQPKVSLKDGRLTRVEALGEHVFEWFLRNKRAEWRDYKTQITQFELDRYYRNV